MFFSAFPGTLGVRVQTYSTPWDLTTPAGPLSDFYDFNANFPSSTLKSVTFSKTGLKMFILASGDIFEFDLSVAWSNSTITHVGTRTQFQANNPLYISVSAERLFFSERESNTQINQYQLNVFNDTRATRSVVRFCAYILWQAMGDRVVEQVDWEAMEALDVLLESRGDNLDAEFVDETTLWEVLRSALLVGYAEPTIKNGLFTPIRVSAGTDFKQLYTPDIMIGELQYDQPFFDGQDSDGVEVEYFDTLNNQTNTIIVNDGIDQGLRPSRVQAIGITDREKAFRFGMRQYNRERYKPARITFTTEMDALNSEYGDPIAIGSSLWGSQFGEIMNYNNVLMIATLSFIPSFASGDHFLSLRDKEGSTEIYLCTAVGGEPFQVELVSNPTFDPVFAETIDSTFVTFGKSDEVFKRAIVRKIEPQDEGRVTITAEEYLDLVYQSDNATLGAAPWIVPQQILNHAELRVAGDTVGFVDIGGQYKPEDVTFTFSNGTVISDDGFFSIGNGPTAGQVKITVSGAANASRNDFDTLPNESFYSVKATFGGEDSADTNITIKVLDSLLPPENTIAYWPIEEAVGSNLDESPDYINQTYNFGNSPEFFLTGVDGLFNFGFGYDADSAMDLFSPPADLKESESGTWWFVVKKKASMEMDLKIQKDIVTDLNSVILRATSTGLSIFIDYSDTAGSPETNLDITYNYVAAVPDFFLVAFVSDGSDFQAYTSFDGFLSETSAVGDASLRSIWNDDIFENRATASDILRLRGISDTLVIAAGYVGEVMTLEKLNKLSAITLKPD